MLLRCIPFHESDLRSAYSHLRYAFCITADRSRGVDGAIGQIRPTNQSESFRQRNSKRKWKFHRDEFADEFADINGTSLQKRNWILALCGNHVNERPLLYTLKLHFIVIKPFYVLFCVFCLYCYCFVLFCGSVLLCFALYNATVHFMNILWYFVLTLITNFNLIVGHVWPYI